MKKKGFTLVELMTVVAIIAIIAAVAVPIYTRQRCKADWGEVQSCLSDLALRMENYRSNHGRYPDDNNIWALLNYDGGAAPTCGEHYQAFAKTTNTTYTIWYADTVDPLRCTPGSPYPNDVWAMVNVSPSVIHVFNTVEHKTETLPAGYTIP